jgi:hypothetical protein
MKLETQFSRFHKIGKSLIDDHLVALILASVSDSSDFSSVLHSAMWEDETSLTIAKVKSVLISAQRRLKSDIVEEAHHSKFKPQHMRSRSFNNSSIRRHNRRPRNPATGWRCPECEMDNHTRENCFRKPTENRQQKQQGVTIPTKRANQVGEENQSEIIAQAFAGNSQMERTPRHTPYAQSSIKSRLGAPVVNSPDHGIFPKRSMISIDHHSDHDDILDIDYEDFIDYDDLPRSGTHERKSQSKNSLRSLLQNGDERIPTKFAQSYSYRFIAFH